MNEFRVNLINTFTLKAFLQTQAMDVTEEILNSPSTSSIERLITKLEKTQQYFNRSFIGLDDRVDVYETVELFYYFDIEVKDFTVTEVNVLKDVNSELRKLALNYLGANSFDELEHLDSTPEVIDVCLYKRRFYP